MNDPLEIKYYKDSADKSPFLEWLESLDDRMGRAKIKVNIDRLEQGNFGSCRSLGGGLHELKIHYGPGYRVYFGMMERSIILILGGGLKRTQNKDIEKAGQRWTSSKEGIE